MAASTSWTDRVGLPRTVGGGGETSGRRRVRAGIAAAAPGPRPTVLRPTPNTLSVKEFIGVRLRLVFLPGACEIGPCLRHFRNLKMSFFPVVGNSAKT